MTVGVAGTTVGGGRNDRQVPAIAAGTCRSSRTADNERRENDSWATVRSWFDRLTMSGLG